ncbi:hypothetical protein DMB66_27425 [Actinoplanes sp. ATCC 53533]|nr:hypothetical protein DMB66_41635 [Actinoplanes sp. ATCC 53533]RSM59569.1 hypothetical protein DMB66_27425 [Actinoplanes sp. ATCC 53533]
MFWVTADIDGTDDGDAFAVTWQAYVHSRFPDGPLGQLADYLANSARRPGTVTVDLDPPTVHRLLLAVELRPAGLRQLLDRLAHAGMLTQVQAHNGEHFGVHTLRMPPHLMTSNRATDPGA